MEIDFTRLRYFLAVAEELHFKRAADRLHVTPPPLSKQIKLLERELGGPLFEREYHQVRLTPLGEKLVEPARRILDQVAEFKAMAESVTGQPGPLRVGATAYAPSDFLDAFESAITELALTPSVFSITGSAAEVAAELVAGHLDLGLIHLPPTDSRVDFRVIGGHRMGIAVRGDDPLAAHDLLRIEDLRDREVAVDLARANPVLHEALVRRLNSRGITRIVHATASVRGSEIEIAAQIRHRHLVLLLSYAPDSLFARVFSPPEFKLVPIDEATWEPGQLAVAWARSPVTAHPALKQLVEQLTVRFNAS
jgi:DNA-binding transcriptional LysR family regulator